MELRIVQLRKNRGITQSQLAQLCETTQQQITKIERGVGDPQLSTLKRLATALGCGIKDLFYSKSEFLAELKSVAKAKKLNLKKTTILELNSICSQERSVPVLHPFWELVEIKNEQIVLKEDK